MPGHTRRCVLLLKLLVALACCTAAQAAPQRAGPPLLEDAALWDVTFVDKDLGWAVGDRGIIWHTEDGGISWKRQMTGVEVSLRSVCFLSRDIGWAVGGMTNPYTHISTGMVLYTQDGGRRWTQRAGRELPALRQVRFFTPDDGIATGEPSTLFPSGVFTTDDGGKRWRPVPGGRTTGWLTADFRAPTLGAMAGRSGELAILRDRTVGESRTPPLGLRNARKLVLTGEVRGWMVGDGGLVLETSDLGKSWQGPPTPPPIETADAFDFHAVSAFGPHCWIAGAPGSRVLFTNDAGRTWQWGETGQSLPIHAIWFADSQNGWAVGPLGMILASSDGGRTWKRQRSGGTRAAYLTLVGDAEDVPLELIAHLSGNEGYLGVAHLVTRRDPNGISARDANLPDRMHEALTAVGGSHSDSGWQFPMPAAGVGWKPQQVVQVWNDVNDGAALEKLEGRLVREIRTWRPEVVITYAATPDPTRPMAHLLNQTVLSAVEKAGESTWYPDQVTRQGLKTWKPRKVLGTLPQGTLGEVNLETARVALRLGRSLADYSATPRGILNSEPSAAPAAWGFQFCLDRIPQEAGRRDFFAGIMLHPGGEARRDLLDASPDAIHLQKRMAEKRRNLDAILARSNRTEQGTLKVLGQVGDLVKDLDELLAGQILFSLAQQHYKQGHGDMAAETMDLLVAKYPEHPLAGKAMTWLVQYWSSGEVAWRVQQTQNSSEQNGQFQIDPAVRQASGEVPAGERPNTGLEARRSTNLSLDDRKLIDRPAKAETVAKWIEKAKPELFHEPQIRFPLAATHKRKGLGKEAEKFYLNLRQGREQDAWWACAEGERWLEKPVEQSPKPLWRCARSKARPKLDGQFDDPLWQHVRPAVLKSPVNNDAGWPAACWMAHDDEFLYLAIECRKCPEFRYVPGEGPRPRDPDLSEQDRVQIYLDLDRDWTTYYRLVIDHRGWVAEDCWGDATWNPQWYVAADSDESTWRVEAAIPLTELTGKPPTRDQVWSAGVTRTAPGVGFQSWTLPASPQPQGEGFGYLVFE